MQQIIYEFRIWFVLSKLYHESVHSITLEYKRLIQSVRLKKKKKSDVTIKSILDFNYYYSRTLEDIIIIIYLLTAIGLSPGGSTHLHTNNT
jgi:hypothetical protein